MASTAEATYAVRRLVSVAALLAALYLHNVRCWQSISSSLLPAALSVSGFVHLVSNLEFESVINSSFALRAKTLDVLLCLAVVAAADDLIALITIYSVACRAADRSDGRCFYHCCRCRRLNVSVVGARTWCTNRSQTFEVYPPVNPRVKSWTLGPDTNESNKRSLWFRPSLGVRLVCFADGFGRKVLWALHPQYRLR